MADTKLKVGDVTFTPAELSKTYQTYRKELIVQPMLAMDSCSSTARYERVSATVRR